MLPCPPPNKKIFYDGHNTSTKLWFSFYGVETNSTCFKYPILDSLAASIVEKLIFKSYVAAMLCCLALLPIKGFLWWSFLIYPSKFVGKLNFKSTVHSTVAMLCCSLLLNMYVCMYFRIITWHMDLLLYSIYSFISRFSGVTRDSR